MHKAVGETLSLAHVRGANIQVVPALQDAGSLTRFKSDGCSKLVGQRTMPPLILGSSSLDPRTHRDLHLDLAPRESSIPAGKT